MKNNLLNSHGLTGTRYNHGANRNENDVMSEENFEEHFNSLLLNNNDISGIGGSVEEMKGLGLDCSQNGLT